MIDINTATPNELLDYVQRHLINQGGQSLSEDGTKCRYRGADGRKCAAGHLIPDEIYDPEMEDTTWESITIKTGLPSSQMSLIVKMQIIHDRYNRVKSWPKQIRGVKSWREHIREAFGELRNKEL